MMSINSPSAGGGQAAVASGHQLAIATGLETLWAGRTAVDSAIAADAVMGSKQITLGALGARQCIAGTAGSDGSSSIRRCGRCST
ncbi:MAG: hypothetical protein CL726_10665 [Chloroflexi bacterium]|nr:hypothetical protein [Chloroflexota bacterium]